MPRNEFRGDDLLSEVRIARSIKAVVRSTSAVRDEIDLPPGDYFVVGSRRHPNGEVEVRLRTLTGEELPPLIVATHWGTTELGDLLTGK